MKSRTTAKFRKAFANLPDSVQKQARQAYRQFQQDTSHPSLRDSNRFTLLCQFTQLVSAKATEQLVKEMVTQWFGF